MSNSREFKTTEAVEDILSKFSAFPVALAVTVIKILTESNITKYTEDDVAIINNARGIYKICFKERKGYPVYLMFRHEYLNQSNSSDKKDGDIASQLGPPVDLPKVYCLTLFDIGKGSFKGICESAASQLIGYLNKRNNRTLVGGKFYHLEGHKNDSICFLTNLVIHAFAVFSHIQLSSATPDDLEKVTNYLTFIKKLRHIQNRKVQEPWRGSSITEDAAGTFERRIAAVESDIQIIQTKIQRALNDRSMAALFASLNTNIQNFVPTAYKVILHLISKEIISAEVSMISIVRSQRSPLAATEANKPFLLNDKLISNLNKVMVNFALSLYDKLEKGNNAQRCLEYSSILKKWIIQDKFDSGIYSRIAKNPQVMQELTMLMAMLEETTLHLRPVEMCIQVASLGGDVICCGEAGIYLDQTIRIILATCDVIKGAWSELSDFINNVDRELASLPLHERTAEDKHWRDNYSYLILNSLTEEYSSSLMSVITSCNDIKEKLDIWKKSPNTKPNELAQTLKALIHETKARTQFFQERSISFESAFKDNSIEDEKHENKEIKLDQGINNSIKESSTLFSPTIEEWKEIDDKLLPTKKRAKYYLEHRDHFLQSTHSASALEYFKLTNDSLKQIDQCLKKQLDKKKNINDNQEIIYIIRGKLIYERVTLFSADNFLLMLQKDRKLLYDELKADFNQKTKKETKKPSKQKYKATVKLAQNYFLSLEDRCCQPEQMTNNVYGRPAAETVCPESILNSSEETKKETKREQQMIPVSNTVSNTFSNDTIITIIAAALNASSPREQGQWMSRQIELKLILEYFTVITTNEIGISHDKLYEKVNLVVNQQNDIEFKKFQFAWNTRIFPAIRQNLQQQLPRVHELRVLDNKR